ncbi:hypothetical protein DFJ58DRAFT_724519 [Suillus subalutaceus]|uniref:uncharacterized protein n=1 Tax=Suillus subalutaceus TaxID=48586 RepID=UPI001B8606B2|nr:uncharacterized protein DFJ58DRAFT_724519 [Suillus subalutaceus]KAG1864964.1 hypothetical protein DFJ58DRAFT_724519 [Suillus subalutaceus]
MSQPRSGCNTWLEDIIKLNSLIPPLDPVNIEHDISHEPELGGEAMVVDFGDDGGEFGDEENIMGGGIMDEGGESGDGPRATQLGWYGPRWKNFLEVTMSECRAQHAIENPFPKLAKDLTGSINEILMASLVEWLEGGQQVEEGIWPDRKHDMAKLLYEDLSTWRSDLKKTIASIVPSMYDLIPPSHVPPQQHENGKTENASHPVLHEASISFFYTGSYRVARRRPEVFQKSLPLECLALVCTAVNCVLDGFAKNGSGKSFPKFTTKEYSSLYTAMLTNLESIMRDPYHGPKLARQLRSWAAAGWQGVFAFEVLHADEVLTGQSPTKSTAM